MPAKQTFGGGRGVARVHLPVRHHSASVPTERRAAHVSSERSYLRAQLGDLVDYCRRNSGFASETDGATISACVNRADLPATRFTLPTSQHARQTPLSKPEQNPVHSPNEFTIARRCGDGKQMNGFDQGVCTLVCIVARAVMLPSDRRTTARMVGVLMDRPSDC